MSALAGKVIAVTGAGRGIGREIALLCAREGAAVVVNDPGVAPDGHGGDAAPAHRTVADIRANGGEAHANLASVAVAQEAASIVEEAVSRFGRIDGVVNCAGILRDAIWHKLSVKDWRAVIDVHLHGTFQVSKAATPYFREQKSGSFVHFTSGAGLVGNIGQANYASAKLGIVGLSQSIALDMMRFGVRSNCIAPIAWTRMIAGLESAAADSPAAARMQALGADRVAPLAAYLLSDAACDVTNQIFGVRRNEIAVFSKPRPLHAVDRAEPWSVAEIAEQVMPDLRAHFPRADELAHDIFSADPL